MRKTLTTLALLGSISLLRPAYAANTLEAAPTQFIDADGTHFAIFQYHDELVTEVSNFLSR